jgi:hypothetical protein
MAVFDKNIRILMLKGEKGEIGDAGDYSTLDNKPQINNITLSGSKSAEDLGLVAVDELDGISEDIGELQTLNTTNKESLVNAINEVNGKTIPVEQGGTGATTAAEARTNLGIQEAYILYDSQNGTNGNIDFSTVLNVIGHNLSDFKYLEFYYSNGDEDTNKVAQDDGMCMARVYKWEYPAEQEAYFKNTINLTVSGSTTISGTTYYATGSTRYDIGTSTAPNMAVRNNNKSVALDANRSGSGNFSNWRMSVGSANIKVYRVVGYLV